MQDDERLRLSSLEAIDLRAVTMRGAERAARCAASGDAGASGELVATDPLPRGRVGVPSVRLPVRRGRRLVWARDGVRSFRNATSGGC